MIFWTPDARKCEPAQFLHGRYIDSAILLVYTRNCHTNCVCFAGQVNALRTVKHDKRWRNGINIHARSVLPKKIRSRSLFTIRHLYVKFQIQTRKSMSNESSLLETTRDFVKQFGWTDDRIPYKSCKLFCLISFDSLILHGKLCNHIDYQ